MKILFVASEAAPFIKSGGLGDVLEALPRALAESNEAEVSVILPLYKSIKHAALPLCFLGGFAMPSPLKEEYVGLFSLKQGSVTYYFIDNEYYFCRDGGPYGHGDDGARFLFFSRAVLEALKKLSYFPDVIHANDWQSAAIPALWKAFYAHLPAYARIRTLFTIHNIEYQGRMPKDFFHSAMGLPPSFEGVMCHGDAVNLMKSAIVLSDRVTTVSRTYAHELCYPFFAHGLEGVIREHAYKFSGIVNGINTALYDPMKDQELKASYSASDPTGKSVCKRALQEELGLPLSPKTPVVAIVSRLVPHKGVDLIACVLEELLSRDLQLVVLGTGDGQYESLFRYAQASHPASLAVRIAFDSGLASRIYAGADLFLMPSKSEPCGLSQQIAMRYGAIPIVRETGGLSDTVPPLDPITLTGRGFTFKAYNAHDMLDAVDRALSFFADTERRERHIAALLGIPLGWENAAKEYLSIYKGLSM